MTAGPTAASAPRLVLASTSPRRRDLLRAAGYTFEVHPADIDEENDSPGTLPAELAERLAILKARALAGRFPAAVILAADTVVAFGDRPLGKPADDDAAHRMIHLLAGTTHVVATGVAVFRPADGFERSVRVLSAVRMRPLSAAEIDAYVASGQWRGKAGGYGIQDEYGGSDPFVTRMTGSRTNVVGLPMEATAALLSAAGVHAGGGPGTSLAPPSTS